MLPSTYNYLISVRRDFLFLLVLGLGCVILLWHSLGLPYNYFGAGADSVAEQVSKKKSSSSVTRPYYIHKVLTNV